MTQANGTADLILNEKPNSGNGWDGTYSIRLHYPTAGNRSLLANDYTQINDLGYGLIATQWCINEQVSNQHTIVTSFMLTMVVRLDH